MMLRSESENKKLASKRVNEVFTNAAVYRVSGRTVNQEAIFFFLRIISVNTERISQASHQALSHGPLELK